MIREAVRVDRDAVASLWLGLLQWQASIDPRIPFADDALDRFHADYPAWLADGSRRLTVAEVDGELVGFASGHRTAPPPIYKEIPEIYLDELFVSEKARRRGIGSDLFADMRRWAQSVAASRIRLATPIANESGVAFWKAVGATPIAVSLVIEVESSAQEGTSHPFGFVQRGPPQP